MATSASLDILVSLASLSSLVVIGVLLVGLVEERRREGLHRQLVRSISRPVPVDIRAAVSEPSPSVRVA